MEGEAAVVTNKAPKRTPLFVSPRTVRWNFLKHFVAAVVVMYLSGLMISVLWQVLQPTLTPPSRDLYYSLLNTKTSGLNPSSDDIPNFNMCAVESQITSGLYCAVGAPVVSLLFVIENLSRSSFNALDRAGWIYPIHLFSGLLLLALAGAYYARRSFTSPPVVTRRLLLPFTAVVLNAAILLCIEIANQEADQFTLLHSAAYHGQMTRARILLWFGADVNAGTKLEKATPIEMALMNKHNEMARYLFSKGAYIDKRNSSKYGALNWGLACDFDVFKWLVDNGADLTPTPKGGSVLVNACAYGKMDYVKYLLQHGVPINECNPISGHSPIQVAVDRKHYEMAKYLLENGADPNLNNNVHNTLELAKSDEMRQLLLSYGAVPSATAGASDTNASRESP